MNVIQETETKTKKVDKHNPDESKGGKRNKNKHIE
jgi:hypothetical protein